MNYKQFCIVSHPHGDVMILGNTETCFIFDIEKISLFLFTVIYCNIGLLYNACFLVISKTYFMIFLLIELCCMEE